MNKYVIGILGIIVLTIVFLSYKTQLNATQIHYYPKSELLEDLNQVADLIREKLANKNS